MPWFTVCANLAKVNRVFTFVDLAMTVSMTGVDIAASVDPDSVCVAWDIKGLTQRAKDLGVDYDHLLTELASLSNDLDNLQQATSDFSQLASNLNSNWQAVAELQQALYGNLSNLQRSVPAAEKWISELEVPGLSNSSKLAAIKDQLKLPVGLLVFSVVMSVGLVGSAAYNRWKDSTARRGRRNAVDMTNTPRAKGWAIGKEVFLMAANVGSFAMNVYQVYRLVTQCENQKTLLNTMISTYADAPFMRDLLNGCGGDNARVTTDSQFGQTLLTVDQLASSYGYDKARLAAVKAYLHRSLHGEPDAGAASYDDNSSQLMLMVGLKQIKAWYEHDMTECLDDLDAMFKIIVESHTTVTAPNLDAGAAARQLQTAYADYTVQAGKARDTNQSTADRLAAARSILGNFAANVSPALNTIVSGTTTDLTDSQVRSLLAVKAKIMAGHPDKLAAFRADPPAYVKDQGILDELDSVYPKRSVFLTDAPDSAANVATYLSNCMTTTP